MQKECRSSNNNKTTYWKKGDKVKDKSTFPETKKHIKEIKKTEDNPKEINLIAYQQLHPDATPPIQKTPGSAGYDLTPCENGIIQPGERKQVNTGLAIAIPPDCYGQIFIRSSAAMEGLSLEGGVIDSDYRGPIILILHNHSTKALAYKALGKAIAQLVLIKTHHDDFQPVERLPESTRKGGFGSTDKHLDAISYQPGKCVFDGRINKQQAKILIDSGADGNFIGTNMAKQLGLHLQQLDQPYEVSLPNGHKAKVSQQAQNLPYSIQNHHNKVNLHVVPLDLNTIIFGNQWLADVNPIINWKTKEFTINQNGHTQTISTNPAVERVTAKEFSMMIEDTDNDPQVFAVTLDEDDEHTQEFYNKH
jgi:dUTP pyrophosphatase